jgi:AcrR family transcriptional regulator
MMANRGLTAKGAATRQRIVDGAAALMRLKGPGATNLDDVLEATATSKSQLFHYFPNGREDLLQAVARHEADQVLAAQQPYLADLTSGRKWQAWRTAVVAHYGELGDRCPLGALTAQLGKTSPRTREIVSELYGTWEAYLLAGVQAMAEQGSLSPGISPETAARGILAAIQGGVLMLQATGSLDYLVAGLDTAMFPLRIRGSAGA